MVIMVSITALYNSPQPCVVTESVGVRPLLSVDLEGKSLRVLVLLRAVVASPRLHCGLQTPLVVVMSHALVVQALPSLTVSGLGSPHPPPPLVWVVGRSRRSRRGRDDVVLTGLRLTEDPGGLRNINISVRPPQILLFLHRLAVVLTVGLTEHRSLVGKWEIFRLGRGLNFVGGISLIDFVLWSSV